MGAIQSINYPGDYPQKISPNNIPEISVVNSRTSLNGRPNSVTLIDRGDIKIVEKHFTLDKNFSNFHDHKISANPKEMKELVTKINNVYLNKKRGKFRLSINLNKKKKYMKSAYYCEECCLCCLLYEKCCFLHEAYYFLMLKTSFSK